MKQMGASCRILLAIAALGLGLVAAALLAREAPGGGATEELVPRHPSDSGHGILKEVSMGGDSQYPPSSPSYGSAIGDTTLRVSTTPPAPTSHPGIHDN
jgi:hypothetical protein